MQTVQANAAGAAQRPSSTAIGHSPAAGSRGNDELRNALHASVRALFLGILLLVALDTPAPGKAARAAVAAEVDPGDGQGCSRSKKSTEVTQHARADLRDRDDYWITFANIFLTPSPLFALRA